MAHMVRLSALLCFLLGSHPYASAQVQAAWLGDGASAAWSDPGNWTPSPPQSGSANTIRDLHFGAGWLSSPSGSNFVFANNDLADFRGHSIVFDSAATSPFFTITGNGFTLSDLGGVPPSIIGNTIFDLQTINLTAGQLLRFDGGSTGSAQISGESFIDFKTTAISLVGTTNLRVSGNSSIAIRGPLSGTGGLIDDSMRDVALTGEPKNFTGATVVNQGRLVVSSAVTASPVTVKAGGELLAYRQNGIQAQLATLTVEGGIFSAYDYLCQQLALMGGSYHIRLGASNPGGSVGTVNLNSTTKLVIDPNSETILNGSSLIDNDGSDPIQGRFLDENGNVLNEGDVFASSQNGNRLFRISYSAGTGNDIWLYEVPEPALGLTLLLASTVVLTTRRMRS